MRKQLERHGRYYSHLKCVRRECKKWESRGTENHVGNFFWPAKIGRVCQRRADEEQAQLQQK
jgi:hypothetical protein